MPLQVVDGVGWRSGAEEPAPEALAKGMMRRPMPHPLRHASVLPRESHLSGARLPRPHQGRCSARLPEITCPGRWSTASGGAPARSARFSKPFLAAPTSRALLVQQQVHHIVRTKPHP